MRRLSPQLVAIPTQRVDIDAVSVHRPKSPVPRLRLEISVVVGSSKEDTSSRLFSDVAPVSCACAIAGAGCEGFDGFYIAFGHAAKVSNFIEPLPLQSLHLRAIIKAEDRLI